jgi:Zn-dependent protease with chaperone function
LYVAVAVSLLASLLLGMTAGPMSRRLQPADAVRLLSVAGLGSSLATCFSLSVVAFSQLAQIPRLARAGHWSTAVLHATNPDPALVGPPAVAAVVLLLGAAVRRAGVAVRDLWQAQQACRELGGDSAGLVVVDDARPDAYAVPGVRGRVVVTRAMLRALPAGERRVLLAHEASHLRHRHHLYVLAAELAATADPLLRRVVQVVRVAVERWADEDAATVVGDRRLAARALARAALARSRPIAAAAPAGQVRASGRLSLRMGDSAVVARVRALLAPAPSKGRTVETLAVAALLLAVVAADVDAGQDSDSLFDHAQAVYDVHR